MAQQVSACHTNLMTQIPLDVQSLGPAILTPPSDPTKT